VPFHFNDIGITQFLDSVEPVLNTFKSIG